MGTDTFTYTANDGIAASNVATVAVTVVEAGEGQPPVAANDAASTLQGVGLAIDVLANDLDVD